MTASSLKGRTKWHTGAVEPVAEDRPLPPYYRRIKGSGATAVLSAAMIALGEILEPDKTTVEIEQTDDDRHDPEGFDLSFGDLPNLD
jgi:hypothetical protein